MWSSSIGHLLARSGGKIEWAEGSPDRICQDVDGSAWPVVAPLPAAKKVRLSTVHWDPVVSWEPSGQSRRETACKCFEKWTFPKILPSYLYGLRIWRASIWGSWRRNWAF